MTEPAQKNLTQCNSKLNLIRTLIICSKMAYSCCFSKGGYLDFLQKKFYNIDYCRTTIHKPSITWFFTIGCLLFTQEPLLPNMGSSSGSPTWPPSSPPRSSAATDRSLGRNFCTTPARLLKPLPASPSGSLTTSTIRRRSWASPIHSGKIIVAHFV